LHDFEAITFNILDPEIMMRWRIQPARIYVHL